MEGGGLGTRCMGVDGERGVRGRPERATENEREMPG